MKTITFYSYKGGVGRSLALVNIATRLVEFGKKVCVIDFDLEAPGLHLKFPGNPMSKSPKNGIVDYVYEFSNNGILIDDIREYVTEVNITSTEQPISLISAGNTESSEYWKKLSSINWYELIYDNPNGLAFFLNLKERIKADINPDFLLIDSRTGISEMSGITLSMLADEIVIIAANNRENLSGAQRIIKSLNDPSNSILDRIPNINFVLSRIPFTDKPEDRSREQLLINKIKRQYLLPYLSELNVIHSDRELEEVESVKIGYEKDESSSQIAIDYLKLFEKLTNGDLTAEEIKRFADIRKSEKLFREALATNSQSGKIKLISEAIVLNPDNPEFYLYRSTTYRNLESFDAAELDIRKSLEINRFYTAGLDAMIDVLLQQKKINEADHWANEYLQVEPNDINAMLKKLMVLASMGKSEEAENLSSKIIEIDPDFSGAYSCRADARRLQKKFETAQEDIFKALELDSENQQAIITLAEIYAELGKINEFYLHLETVMKHSPRYVHQVINEEEIYKKFYNEPRFLNLLSKYEIRLDSIGDNL